MKLLDKLKEFKKKKLGFFGTILQFLMFHNLSKLIALIIIMTVSAILYYNHNIEFASYFFYASAGILVIFIIISIIFGWIINPIRDRRLNKELLELLEEDKESNCN
jgi:uncharacterized membrane protein YqjE